MIARGPRVTVAVGAALLGFLAVLAASQPRRASRELRRLELADLIRAEDARVRGLADELGTLRDELREVQGSSAGEELQRLQGQAEELRSAAGTSEVAAPGVVVTLSDSEASRSPTGDPNDLIVHERDIQAVVNALWSAGAEAVSIDGERLTATSAVRCAGNTLLLHGSLHSPPYEIAAVGDPEVLVAELPHQPGMERLLAAVDAFGLGLEVSTRDVRMSASAGADPIDLARAA